MIRFFLPLFIIYTFYLAIKAKTTDAQFDHLFGSPLGPPLSTLSSSQQTRLFRNHALAYSGAAVVQLEQDTAYACPLPYTYYSYEDAMNNKLGNCERFKPKATHRILGGGSASGCSKRCQIRPQDTRVLQKAVCVNNDMTNFYLWSSEGRCSEGSARMSYAEAIFNQANCKNWAYGGPTRIGFLGSVTATDSGCVVKEFDPTEMSSETCVQRYLTDIMIVDAGEDVCGEGKTLLTPAEAYARQRALCDLLQPDETARLSGGGSMDGSMYGCRIRDTDRRTLKIALCAESRA